MCGYCDKNYVVMNTTKEYSDIEISLMTNIRGIRVRTIFDETGLFKTQDFIHINYCPMCGRKLGEQDDKRR